MGRVGQAIFDGICRKEALYVSHFDEFVTDLGRVCRGDLSPVLVPRQTDRLTVGAGGHVARPGEAPESETSELASAF